MLENFVERIKLAAGITPLGNYVEIDDRPHAHAQRRLEIMFETAQGRSFVRLRSTEYRGNGSNGRSRKSFAWPVVDPTDPQELRDILRQIFAAGEPDAEVVDPRGGIGRFFDRLCGIDFVNSVLVLAEENTPPRKWLSVRIHDSKFGRCAQVVHHVQGRSQIWLTIPWESLEVLRDKLDGAT